MGLAVNLNNVPNDLNQFPNGAYLAEIIEAEEGVTGKGGPTMNLKYRINHSKYGMTEVRDGLPLSFPGKIKSFWTAFNHTPPQEQVDMGEVELVEDELIGGTLIIVLGEREGTDKQGNSRTFKQVVSPFYYPDDRDDVLVEAESPF